MRTPSSYGLASSRMVTNFDASVEVTRGLDAADEFTTPQTALQRTRKQIGPISSVFVPICKEYKHTPPIS